MHNIKLLIIASSLLSTISALPVVGPDRQSLSVPLRETQELFPRQDTSQSKSQQAPKKVTTQAGWLPAVVQYGASKDPSVLGRTLHDLAKTWPDGPPPLPPPQGNSKGSKSNLDGSKSGSKKSQKSRSQQPSGSSQVGDNHALRMSERPQPGNALGLDLSSPPGSVNGVR